MRLVYCGTPVEAVAPLDALHAAGHDIALVITQPDRRRGRRGLASPSPVRATAERLGLAVRTPERAKEVVDEVRATGAEVGVVVAFGQLLPPLLLDALPRGFVNVHFSLLPRWRGAAPVQRAILAGDAETGVCVMALEEGLDTGPVYACVRTPIDDDETAGELASRLVALGTELLLRVLPETPTLVPEPQGGAPTYADKLTIEEFRLHPGTQDAATLTRIVRAGNPRPGAWCIVDGSRVKVLRAHAEPGDGPTGTIDADGRMATRGGTLALDEVQPEGGRVMTAPDWLRGSHGRTRRVDDT